MPQVRGRAGRYLVVRRGAGGHAGRRAAVGHAVARLPSLHVVEGMPNHATTLDQDRHFGLVAVEESADAFAGQTIHNPTNNKPPMVPEEIQNFK